ncbi:MAG: BON domain-containing protein [Dehalococcoidia bacterium]|jgi:osmotically-inducible protein OsmY
MVATHHDRQSEETILSTFNKARLADVETLRVLVVEGVVYIDGHVSNYRAKKAISQLAASAPGLRKVVNRSRVVPAALVHDEALAERVRRSIQSHPLLRGGPISVRCTEGVIELAGTVDRPSLRLHAEDAAWSMRGVRQVLNKLQVSHASVPEEREIGQNLEQHLQYCLGVAPWQISVEVERETAYLRGRVPSLPLRQLAEDLVRWHPHIRDVVNCLIAEEPSSHNHHLTTS